jgi:hypothetical protein
MNQLTGRLPRPMKLTAALLFCLLAGGTTITLSAQDTANNILTPQSMLGFEPGADRKLADWPQITAYFKALDAASDRVALREIGKTTLGRTMLLAVISSPANLRDLRRYQEIQRKLADPRLVQSSSEADELIRRGKAVVAISCSIHSNEVVASQMSMQLAYTLASEDTPEMRAILDNTIILLIPSANPDGTDIVTGWYRQTLGTPAEGSLPPELYHHYAGHDNNRDWFMLNLAETRVITDLFYKEWFPAIVYDVHQQGEFSSRFFVPPFLDPPNPNIDATILRQVALVGSKMAADAQAAGLKGVGTSMLYDTWWHGGMRTAPYYHNAVGILSEAASARLATPVTITAEELRAGRRLNADDASRAGRETEEPRAARGLPNPLERATNFPDPWPGGEWRMRDILRLEMIASRSLLKLASFYREDFLRNFYEAGRRALSAGEREAPFAYVVPKQQHDEFAAAKMAGILAAQGVEVHEARAPFTADGVSYVAGSRVVLMRQPYRACAKALLEVQHYPERRLYPGGPAERPYDVAGWTLPMQMGVACVEVKNRFDAELKLLAGADLREHARRNQPRVENKTRVALYKSYSPSMDEGWTRFVFDEWKVKYTSLFDAEVRGGNLRAKYDVIVLADQRGREITNGNSTRGYPQQFSGGIGPEGVKALGEFVEAGGTLVCFDNAARFAIEEFKLPVRNALAGLKTSEFYCPGSILRVEASSPQHPLLAGMPAAFDAYFTHSSAFEIQDKSQVQELARYAASDVLRSGWLLGEKYLAGKTALAEAKLGRGRVVLFGFRPQHRAQTWGTFRLVFNSLR